MKIFISCFFLFFSTKMIFGQVQNPNILLIIADDLGIDVLNGFGIEGQMPNTPTLDSLRESGLTFTNCWATPQCTPTRAAIMSGKYGVKTGVLRPPGPLDIEHTSLFQRIKNEIDQDYEMAVFGKWHIGGNDNLNHPFQTGVDHFEGLYNSSVNDYYNWTKVRNGEEIEVTEYFTTHITDLAIDWLNDKSSPWFLWLAHIAPHGPFHDPPIELHTTNITNTRTQYLAMIESMDKETRRLIESLDDETLDNTIFIFIGDNGTPGSINEFYPQGHAKGSIYEGGIRVPMIISGKNIGRQGDEEKALVQVTDLHATILELLGHSLQGGIENSLSLKPLLNCDSIDFREINYSDYNDNGRITWATRTANYKLIDDENNNQEFYNITTDIKEEINLIDTMTPAQEAIKNRLEEEAQIIRSDWSCNDGILNGSETFIDDCNNNCPVIDELQDTNIGCCEEPDQPSVYYEFIENESRIIYSNTYPNHDYCFNNRMPEPVYKLYAIDIDPQLSGSLTPVIRDNGTPGRFFGVALNGIFIMPAPGLPFVFENQETGEYNWDWVFEPTNNQGSGQGYVSLDCASAHTNNNGYHYHGNMFEYMEMLNTGITTSNVIPEKPIQIGWASDGFPILYRFGPDKDGNLKEMKPSFQLKSGLRPGDGISSPCGPYSGKYTADYKYICGKGDLDECNGIDAPLTLSTPQGEEVFSYYYVVTSDFPQIGRCMKGFVSEDFENGTPSLQDVDNDDDGFVSQFDCDDNDPMINPFAQEISGNAIDENCDGLLTTAIDINELGLQIYPQPNNGQFWIKGDNINMFQFVLHSINGQILSNIKRHTTVEFSNLQSGIYFLNVYKENVLIGMQKVIVL